MIASSSAPSLAAGSFADVAVDWLGTFAVHSTIALCLALLLPLVLRNRAQGLQERVLRLSLWVALFSSTLQCTLLDGAWSSNLVLLSAAEPPLELGSDASPVLALPSIADSVSAVGDLPWPRIALYVAVAAAGLGLGWLFTIHRRLAQVLATREPETDARVLTTAAEVASRLGLRQSPHVSRSDCIATPIAFGWLRPEICLPMRASSLRTDSLRAMLAHEIAHLRRCDPAWMWLAAWLQALFPWQPFLCLVRRRWSRLVEFRCDAIAAQQSSSTAVARCLVDVAEWLRPGRDRPVVALGMAARPSALRERVEAVLHARIVRTPNRVAAAVLSSVSLTTLTLAAPGITTTRPDLVFEGAAGTPPAMSSGEDSMPPLQSLLALLQAEQVQLSTDAARLQLELRVNPVTPELLQMEATLRRRLLELDRSRTRLEALVERRAPRSR